LNQDEVVVRVRELMTMHLISMDATETVIEAAKLMDENDISSVLIKRQGDFVGILTDRDIITRVMSKGLDARMVRVSEVMSSPLKTIGKDASVEEAAKKMAEHNIRRLVVEHDQQKIGIIAESDIIRVDSELHFLIRERSKLEAKTTPKEPKRVTLAGYCEECGNYSVKLKKISGQWLDEDCIN